VFLKGGQVLCELCTVEAVESVRIVRPKRVQPLRLGQLVSRGRDAVVDKAFVRQAVLGVEESLLTPKEAALEEF